jgi:hypothetical protein
MPAGRGGCAAAARRQGTARRDGRWAGRGAGIRTFPTNTLHGRRHSGLEPALPRARPAMPLILSLSKGEGHARPSCRPPAVRRAHHEGLWRCWSNVGPAAMAHDDGRHPGLEQALPEMTVSKPGATPAMPLILSLSKGEGHARPSCRPLVVRQAHHEGLWRGDGGPVPMPNNDGRHPGLEPGSIPNRLTTSETVDRGPFCAGAPSSPSRHGSRLKAGMTKRRGERLSAAVRTTHA